MALTPEQKSAQARSARLAGWAQCEDWTAATAPGRTAFLSRFERQVDPDGRLDPVMRAKRAEAAKKAYFVGLAFKSSKARSAKAARKRGGDGPA